jgi:hypothetical protein
LRIEKCKLTDGGRTGRLAGGQWHAGGRGVDFGIWHGVLVEAQKESPSAERTPATGSFGYLVIRRCGYHQHDHEPSIVGGPISRGKFGPRERIWRFVDLEIWRGSTKERKGERRKGFESARGDNGRGRQVAW